MEEEEARRGASSETPLYKMGLFRLLITIRHGIRVQTVDDGQLFLFFGAHQHHFGNQQYY